MAFAAEFGTEQVAWSFLWGALAILWAALIIVTLGRIIFDHELSGWAKAGWTLLVIVLPFLGVIIFLAVRGGKLTGPSRSKQPRIYNAGLGY